MNNDGFYDYEEDYLKEIAEIKQTIRSNRTLQQRDRVFKRLADIPPRKRDGENCHICKKELLEEDERICKFCGKRVCGACSPKKREDPLKTEHFVRICDKCDLLYLKELLVGERNRQTKHLKKQQIEEEQTEINLKKQLMELSTEVEHKKTKWQQTKSEDTERLQEITQKYNKKREKVDNIIHQVADSNNQRRQIKENAKKLEDQQSNLLDDINQAVFDKNKLTKEEERRDQQQQELKDFIYNFNTNITSQNLTKKHMDSVLGRKVSDSQFRESDYDIFQETPNTPSDMKFRFDRQASSSSSQLTQDFSSRRK